VDEEPAPGFTREDYEDECVEVWPENWPAFDVFRTVRTQWIRAGMAGNPSGLLYASVYPLLDRIAESPEHWKQLLDDVQTLEAAALQVLNKKTDP
jgi:hypothetical protein